MENTGKSSVHQCLAILVMAMIFSLNYDQALAFSSTTTSSNSSGSQCSGSMQECLIVNDANLVFFADPETSLVTKPPKVTGLALKKLLAITDCGKGKPYHPCVPDPNNPKKAENCKSIYKDNNRNRGCK
ncbi:hypothetical protein PTKIN_Ptkin12aG0022700 [Pterospermum kingtungense]